MKGYRQIKMLHININFVYLFVFYFLNPRFSVVIQNLFGTAMGHSNVTNIFRLFTPMSTNFAKEKPWSYFYSLNVNTFLKLTSTVLYIYVIPSLSSLSIQYFSKKQFKLNVSNFFIGYKEIFVWKFNSDLTIGLLWLHLDPHLFTPSKR